MPDYRPSASKWEEWSKEVLTQLINLNNKSDNLSKENNSLKDKIATMGEDLNGKIDKIDESLNKKIDIFNEILNGNGHPEKGIVVRIAILEEAKHNFDGYIEQEKEGRKWIFRFVAGGLLAALASLGIAILKWFYTGKNP